MKYFAGLDVSLKETAICVVDETGTIIKEARAASEPQALKEALLMVALPLERIRLEACSLTASLHDGLRIAGLPAIYIEKHDHRGWLSANWFFRIAVTRTNAYGLPLDRQEATRNA